jgi:NAD(P)-dependent dehydrogenase (short-subunit alcohol dehydrogenase family)
MQRKHSIIIGGTKGVGRELAAILAAQGQYVTAVGRSPATFPPHDGAGNIEALQGDAENAAQLLDCLRKQIVARGALSSLVFMQRYRGSGDSWQGEFNVAVTATKTLIEGLADQFSPECDRSIAIVASVATDLIARNQSLGYHVSKSALRQMARYYAVKLGSKGIRVNVISPCTFVKDESAAYYGGQTALKELYARIVPLGRWGTAREVAQTAAFLCGPQASFITGQEVVVDGGLSLMLQDAMAREVAGIGG